MKTPRSLLLAALLFAVRSSAAELDSDLFSGVTAAKARAAAEQAARRTQAVSGGTATAPVPQAAANRSIDLLPQFADPSRRDQCTIGSCHAFGSVAVLEAAYFRKYKEHISLAEADVFLRRTVLSGDVYRDFCNSGTCTLTEGNFPDKNIRYVLAHGALTNGSYGAFARRYARFRAGEEKTLEGIQKTYEGMGWLEKLFYDPRKHWKELSTSESSKKILADALQGRGTYESTEREQIKKKFAGFTLRSKSDFDFKPEYKDLRPKDCLAHGLAQAAALKSELDANRPVCVSMSLSGLPAWGQNDATRDAYHAFMIIGYEETPKGLVFRTRNSWGGKNPDVKVEESCRIYAIDSVLAPGEKATF